MKVYIEDLTFDCIIGILDFERVTPQKVLINISFEYKYTNNKIPKLELGNEREATITPSFQATDPSSSQAPAWELESENTPSNFIDYSEISTTVEKIMCKEKFELLEDAIIYLENYLNKTYSIKNLKIKISKPNILTNCIVSLEN